jgi:hypothetical protein
MKRSCKRICVFKALMSGLADDVYSTPLSRPHATRASVLIATYHDKSMSVCCKFPLEQTSYICFINRSDLPGSYTHQLEGR